MEISQASKLSVPNLYTYPIKSLRGASIKSSQVTKHGFPYDRRFLLQKISHDASAIDSSGDSNGEVRNMTITYFPELALFQQELKMADEAESSPSVVMVTHRNSDTGEQQQIEVLLQPDPTVLEQVDVTLHQSPTKAYNMGSRFNSWFSSRVGYEVRLVYLGPHLRTVLGNLSANSTGRNAKTSRSWIPTIAHSLAMIGIPPSNETDRITFADVAPYLIVTRESLQDVSSRLAGDVQMDITKFRPNIVLSGSAVAYDEDFWGGLEFFTSNAAKRGEHCGAVRMALTHNCTRCVSINVDYNTGKPAVGDTGTVLKKLMKDRRVDGGAKYSPVFGRYGFLETGSQAPLKLAVGDVVKVTKRNAERTKIEWPGLWPKK